MSSRISIVFATATAAVATFAWAGEGGSLAAPIAPSPATHSSAQLVECKRGKQATVRRAIFRGEMTQVAGATRMTMRFSLHRRVGSEQWRGVAVPGIDQPHEARPGVTRFAYRQRVLNLDKGMSYRAAIDFRWYAADGAEVRREIVRSPVCRQPGKLPNPKIRDTIKVADGPTPETRRYVVRIGNTGRVTVANVMLRLSVDGAEVDTRRIGRLAAGQRRSVGFVGPVCRTAVEARLDPDDLIPEIFERDNLMRDPCDRLEPLPPA